MFITNNVASNLPKSIMMLRRKEKNTDTCPCPVPIEVQCLSNNLHSSSKSLMMSEDNEAATKDHLSPILQQVQDLQDSFNDKFGTE